MVETVEGEEVETAGLVETAPGETAGEEEAEATEEEAEGAGVVEAETALARAAAWC